MNDSSGQSVGELDRLLSAWCDEALADAELAALEALLQSGPAARRHFAVYMQMHAVAEHYLDEQLPASASEVLPQQADAAPAAAPTRSPVLGFLNDSWQVVQSSPRTVMAILGTSLVGYFVVTLALIPLARWVAQDRGVQHSPAASSPARPKSQSNIGALATGDEAHWSHEPADVRVGLGKRYDLASGQVQLVLARGTRVVIEGPAAWQFDSEQQLRLHAGRIAARVPHAAVGFTVNTPTARIVDLGTEFAVDVDTAGTTSVSVLYGTVELTQHGAAAEKPRQDAGAVRVTAGQAVKVTREGSGAVTAQVADVDATWARQALERDIAADAAVSSRRLAALPAGRRVAAFQTVDNPTGNQDTFNGGLGTNFRVERPIRVYSLGVFDHLGDGIVADSTLTVQLWLRDLHQFKNPTYNGGGRVVAEQTFSSDATGSLLSGYRYKPLDKPVDLPPGRYAIVAYGFSPQNPNFNDVCETKIDPQLRLEDSDGVLSTIESRFTFSGPGAFPNVFQKDSLSFGAGSFEYAPLEDAKASPTSP